MLGTGVTLVVRSVLGAQFAHAPMLANPDQVTLREEDQIAAYFASGNLYAEPSRMEPLLWTTTITSRFLGCPLHCHQAKRSCGKARRTGRRWRDGRCA